MVRELFQVIDCEHSFLLLEFVKPMLLYFVLNCIILSFQMARSKKACIVFFDEVDAIGGARFDDGVGGDNEVQRTMLEIVNQLDGFDARGNIKVLMATNRSVTIPSYHLQVNYKTQ